MKDNILKKEFQKKDVERLRNLVKGKSNQKLGQGVGYTKKEEFHNEGDIWMENNRRWTIKDGIKEISDALKSRKIKDWKNSIYYNNKFPFLGTSKLSKYYWQ